jgi:hypothetical protein
VRHPAASPALGGARGRHQQSEERHFDQLKLVLFC